MGPSGDIFLLCFVKVPYSPVTSSVAGCWCIYKVTRRVRPSDGDTLCPPSIEQLMRLPQLIHPMRPCRDTNDRMRIFDYEDMQFYDIDLLRGVRIIVFRNITLAIVVFICPIICLSSLFHLYVYLNQTCTLSLIYYLFYLVAFGFICTAKIFLQYSCPSYALVTHLQLSHLHFPMHRLKPCCDGKNAIVVPTPVVLNQASIVMLLSRTYFS